MNLEIVASSLSFSVYVSALYRAAFLPPTSLTLRALCLILPGTAPPLPRRGIWLCLSSGLTKAWRPGQLAYSSFRTWSAATDNRTLLVAGATVSTWGTRCRVHTTTTTRPPEDALRTSRSPHRRLAKPGPRLIQRCCKESLTNPPRATLPQLDHKCRSRAPTRSEFTIGTGLLLRLRLRRPPH